MAKKTNAVIVGGGVSKFGVREAQIFDLFQEAAKACSDDIPALKPTNVNGLIVCTTLAGRHSSALNTAPLVAHRLGLKPTSICIRLDTLCAGSNSGIIVAKGLVESGGTKERRNERNPTECPPLPFHFTSLSLAWQEPSLTQRAALSEYKGRRASEIIDKGTEALEGGKRERKTKRKKVTNHRLPSFPVHVYRIEDGHRGKEE